jgi:hypothetical protein
VDKGCYKMTIFSSLSGGVRERSPSKCSPGTLLLNILFCGLGGWKAANGMPLI